MFRRLQRLRRERNASETLQRQSTSSIVPNGNLQTFNGGSLLQRQSPQQRQSTSSNLPSDSPLLVQTASDAEALQSLDSDPESESSLESVGADDTARRQTADEAEAARNLDFGTLAEQRSLTITCEFRPGVFRPLRAGGPWIPWNCPGSDSESHELSQILDDEELQQDVDDELLLPLDGLEWEELDFEAPTTLPSPSVTDMLGSQSSKASSAWSAVS
eukprot:TRINITY_DN533_c0_g1_i2.p1 TRINITY_DN533_c0_g1~~TRINITY_DN533_c0_g1_i2.p1  ORF type:complete len:217 (+),score=40.35 TRINITY_DN533_c0_g1_i2:127-777(+)